MKPFNRLAIWLVLACLVFSCSRKKPNVCGTWRMVEGYYDGPNFQAKTNTDIRICYKIISESHFAVIEMYSDNPDSMFFAAVGSYEIDDSTYTEIYEASNVPTKIGEKMVFQSSIENNTWKIKLNRDDLSLDETWVCVKAAPGNE